LAITPAQQPPAAKAAVDDPWLKAGIVDGSVQRVDQAHLVIDLPEQGQSAVAGQLAARKIDHDLFALKAGNQQALFVTLCR